MSEEIVSQESTDVEAHTPQSDYDIDAFLEKRAEFIEKVNKIMVDGKDYHIIQGRKSMAKGGAEKIASIFGWTATFNQDQDSMSAFKDVPGIVCFVCNLEKNGQLIGQGRGAATLAKNGSDPNKTLKMAQKSAYVDAVIRASGLSDFYTQDIGPEDEGSSYGHVKGELKPSDAQLQLIADLMKQKGYDKADIIDQGLRSSRAGKKAQRAS